MEKTILDKIREVLAANDIDEEVITKVEDELNVEEAPVEEPVVEEEAVELEEPSEEVVPEEETDEAPVEEDMPVSEEAETPVEELPEGVEEVKVGEALPEEPVPEEEPMPEMREPAPEFDATMLTDLQGQLEEQKKANEGLIARIEALESALKEAGVMGEVTKKEEEVGIDDGTRTPDYHDDEADFEATLDKFNKGY